MSYVMKDISVILQTPGALTPLLWGDTGVGKTARMRQMSLKLDWVCEAVLASNKLPEDIGGCLIPSESGRPHRIPDDFVYRIQEAVEAGEDVLLFFDEMSCVPPAVQSVLLAAILDLTFGSVSLPKDRVHTIAAANPADVAAGGFDLADPLAARFTHIVDDDPTEGFCNWLRGGDGANIETPKVEVSKQEEWYSKARALLAAYLGVFPSQAIEGPRERSGRDPKRFACPRTWDNALRLYASAMSMDDEEMAVRMVENAVGPLGIQFFAWAQEQDIPLPVDMLDDPSIFEHDDKRPDRTFAALSAVAHYATVADAKRWGDAWPVLSRAIDTGAHADEITPAVIQLAGNRPKGGLTNKAVLPHVKKVATLVKDVQLLAEAG